MHPASAAHSNMMDLEISMWEYAFGLWHTYRVEVILTTALVLIVLRTYLRYVTRDANNHRADSVPSSPGKRAVAAAENEKNEKIDEYPLEKEIGVATTSLQELKDVVEEQLATANSRTRTGPKRVTGIKPAKTKTGVRKSSSIEDVTATGPIKIQPMVFFTSLTGTTETLAKAYFEELQAVYSDEANQQTFAEPQLHDISYIDFDDFFISGPKEIAPGTKPFYCLLIPSYNIDTILTNFLTHLDETHHDFRIDTAPMSPLAGYSVFGLGDLEQWPTEEEGYCSQAIEADKWLAKLTGRKRAFPLGMGDVKGDMKTALQEWKDGVLDVMKDISVNGGLGEGVPGSGNAVESDEEESEAEEAAEMADLEDIKFNAGSKPTETDKSLPVDFTTYSKTQPTSQSAPKEMVPTTSPTYTALTKQGYTIVGSHSGVKICRWTKSALRGRGSCYKNSFYGIKSHLCMETTPSLSCSNKCVFCWRHGTNPVGTTWRWKVDPPEMIFNGVKEGHYKKIKMMRGVPGVRAERFAEAMRIRHCALSLVGEPIFYPHINEFLAMLHSEHISSFLVCNAQHPDQLATLKRVTQLYVSIDASNRDALRKIDRPLNRDFWERFQRCLDILREKRFVQRTVFRLTLVKGFNSDPNTVVEYADLVEKGLPCFVEVKGVTYCGNSTSAGAGLTMQNVPFYEEVVQFVEGLNDELNRRGLEYGIAAEHAHSCCILLASNRFKKDGKWHTRINYPRFFELLESGKTDEEWGPEDYMHETEEWATWGKGGFDPKDERVYRKGKKKGLTADEVKAVEEMDRSERKDRFAREKALEF